MSEITETDYEKLRECLDANERELWAQVLENRMLRDMVCALIPWVEDDDERLHWLQRAKELGIEVEL